MPASWFAAWANAPAKTRDTTAVEASNARVPEGNSRNLSSEEVTPVTWPPGPGSSKKQLANQLSIPGNPCNLEHQAYRAEPGIAVDPGQWRDIFEQRAAYREFNGSRSRAEAEILAWGELLNKWHLLHAWASMAGMAVRWLRWSDQRLANAH
jgi:hypothetical protein